MITQVCAFKRKRYCVLCRCVFMWYVPAPPTAAPTRVPTAEGVDSISMAQESGSTWTWSCSAQCSTNFERCSIQAAGLRLVGPLTPVIGRLQCRNQINEM